MESHLSLPISISLPDPPQPTLSLPKPLPFPAEDSPEASLAVGRVLQGKEGRVGLVDGQVEGGEGERLVWGGGEGGEEEGSDLC